MEFTGKVTHVGNVESGTSQKTGTQWNKQTIVVEEQRGKYPMSIAVTLLNDTFINSVALGDLVTVSLSFAVHEFNGKFYNNVSAWRISKPQDTASYAINASRQAQTTQAQPQPQPVQPMQPQPIPQQPQPIATQPIPQQPVPQAQQQTTAPADGYGIPF